MRSSRSIEGSSIGSAATFRVARNPEEQRSATGTTRRVTAHCSARHLVELTVELVDEQTLELLAIHDFLLSP